MHKNEPNFILLDNKKNKFRNKIQFKQRYKQLKMFLLGFLSSLILFSFIFYYFNNNINRNRSSNVSSITPYVNVPNNVSNNISDVVRLVNPAIVTVLTGDRMYNLIGNGSGIIYKVENNKVYIITNAHVVENASIIEVYRNDLGVEKSEKVNILDINRSSDIAVLEMEKPKNDYPVSIAFENTETLTIGQQVIAIGSPFVAALGPSFSGSVTTGIISGLNRQIKEDDKWFKKDKNAEAKKYIQTDAAINGGNSGGPLLNMNGKLVGINSAKISSAENISLAISSNYIASTIEKMNVPKPNY